MPSHAQFKEIFNDQLDEFAKRTGIHKNSIAEQLAKATGKEVSVIRSYNSRIVAWFKYYLP